MNLNLKRGKETTKSTPGVLSVIENKFFTIERTKNDPEHSRIPAGTFHLQRYLSPHNGNVLLLQNVPNRNYIEIHSANFASQLKGCIAPGMESGQDFVSRSKEALARILELTKPAFDTGEEVSLTVEDYA